MGQGAGLAVEDGCCLANLLPASPLEASTGTRSVVDDALAEYERLRRPRAGWILKQSYTLGKIAQLESAPLRFLRDWAVRLTPASVNDRALRRIIADMPGVPIDRQLQSPSESLRPSDGRPS